MLVSYAAAGSRDPTIDPLFYSISPSKSQLMEESLSSYINDRGGDGYKFRTSCHLGDAQALGFSNVIGGTYIQDELGKDDVWKAIGRDKKAMAKVMSALKKPRETAHIHLEHGVDVMIAYAAQPDGHVKFWAIAPDQSGFLMVESKGMTLNDIAGPICKIVNELGLNHE